MSRTFLATFSLSLLLVASIAGCGSGTRSGDGTKPKPAPQIATQPQGVPVTSGQAPGGSQALGGTSWTGDFDVMVKHRVVRILTPYSRTQYFIDKGVPRGLVYDLAMMLEKTLNMQLRTTDATKLHVIVIPTSRDALYDALVQGRGDIIAAGVTVTPEREQRVEFTIPTKAQVREIVVTGPAAPALTTVNDLAGQDVAVRAGGIQFESLQKLNETFKQQGKPPVRIRTVPGTLEDEDILEMANAGLLKIVVVNEVYADFWRQILPGITLHKAIAVREDGAFAWAVRKSSPQLIAVLNPFIKANRTGTLFGNQLLRKYLQDTKTVKSATSATDIKKFNELVTMFRKYAGEYSLDYLLMMAQGHQESRLDQSVKSQVGAVGVMQVMPATGKELKVGDITQVDRNVEAGVKYMRFMMDRSYKDEPMDNVNKALFTFASYNAGPARIRQMRNLAQTRGLNPNLWFNNVERVVAEKIGRETVTYVSNIYKYYIAYTLVIQEMDDREKSKAAGGLR